MKLNRTALGIPIVMALLTALVYLPAMSFEFIDADDFPYAVKDPAEIGFNLRWIGTIFFEGYQAAWHPIARTSHALDRLLFDASPSGHHFTSIAIHWLNGVVLFFVLIKLLSLAGYPTCSRTLGPPALLLAAIFVVHPQHVEAVTWISQRKELLASAFSLISLLFFLHDRRRTSIAIAVLALLSKPTAVALPILFVLLDIARSRQDSSVPQRLFLALKRNAFTLFLAVLIGMVAVANHQSESALYLDGNFTALTKVLLYSTNSITGLSNFALLIRFPFHDPLPNAAMHNEVLGFIYLILVTILVSASVYFLFRGRAASKICAAGFLFYFCALLPTGGLVLFGNYAFGDRYLYLSSIGLYIALSILLVQVLDTQKIARRRIIAGFALVALVATTLVSRNHILNYKDTDTVWNSVLDLEPNSETANYALGKRYFLEDPPNALAEPHLLASVLSTREPYRVHYKRISAMYLVEIYCAQGKTLKALEMFESLILLGGIRDDIEQLLISLNYQKMADCHQVLSSWVAERGSQAPEHVRQNSLNTIPASPLQ